MQSEIPENQKLFVGEKSFYVYEKYAMDRLINGKQVYVMAMGAKIPKAINFAHYMAHKYTWAKIASEFSYTEQMQSHQVGDNASTEAEPEQDSNHPRFVPVYQIRLIYQTEEDERGRGGL